MDITLLSTKKEKLKMIQMSCLALSYFTSLLNQNILLSKLELSLLFFFNPVGEFWIYIALALLNRLLMHQHHPLVSRYILQEMLHRKATSKGIG